MVVQHNLSAMNSNRMLGITSKNQAKSTERLSSGYKINRAADDAAGLSISEKMRKQIRGLTQASANAQDGISSVQTAEGALTEVHDMLQRMNELAVKASNSTQSETDRQYIQSEMDQLVTEIDRVSTTTKFNEIFLLKGTNTDGTVAKLTYDTAGTNLANTFVAAGALDNDKGLIKIDTTNTITAALASTEGTNTDVTGKSVTVTDKDGNAWEYILVESTTSQDISADSLSVDGAVKEFNSIANTKAFASMNEMLTALKEDLDYNGDIKGIRSETDSAGATSIKVDLFADLNQGMNLSLQVGADSTDENKIDLNISMMSARGLGINGIKVTGDTSINADNAINTIGDAVQRVSTQRSILGSIQNRLEHTISNLDNVVENTTSAESAIRDTDMATEMVKHTNSNILSQAGQAMLAQANQSNQGILSLLG